MITAQEFNAMTQKEQEEYRAIIGTDLDGKSGAIQRIAQLNDMLAAAIE